MAEVNVGTVGVFTKLDISGLVRGIAGAKAQLTVFGQQATAIITKQNKDMSAAIGEAGTIMAGAGAAIAGGLGMAVKQAAQFDQAMRNVNSIAKLSEGQFASLRSSVMALTNDPGVKDGPAELAKGLYDVYSSGFQGQKALEVLKVAAQGASAGMTDSATSGRALMAVLNSGISGVSGTRAAMDILFKTVDLGVISFGELSASVGAVLPTARAAGVSMQEVGAAIATMTRNGQSGSEAVNDLLNVITKIMRPPAEAAKVFQQYGVEVGVAALQSKGLSGVLQDVIDKTDGNKQAIQNMFPDMQAFRGVMSLATNDGKTYADMLAGMGKASEGAGATQVALAEQMKGAGFQAEKAMQAIKTFGISIGDDVLPMVTPLVGKVADLTKDFSALPHPVKQAAVELTALSGVGMLAVGSLTKIAEGVGAVSRAMTAMGLASKASFGIAIGGIVALAATLKYALEDYTRVQELLGRGLVNAQGEDVQTQAPVFGKVAGKVMPLKDIFAERKRLRAELGLDKGLSPEYLALQTDRQAADPTLRRDTEFRLREVEAELERLREARRSARTKAPGNGPRTSTDGHGLPRTGTGNGGGGVGGGGRARSGRGVSTTKVGGLAGLPGGSYAALQLHLMQVQAALAEFYAADAALAADSESADESYYQTVDEMLAQAKTLEAALTVAAKVSGTVNGQLSAAGSAVGAAMGRQRTQYNGETASYAGVSISPGAAVGQSMGQMMMDQAASVQQAAVVATQKMSDAHRRVLMTAGELTAAMTGQAWDSIHLAMQQVFGQTKLAQGFAEGLAGMLGEALATALDNIQGWLNDRLGGTLGSIAGIGLRLYLGGGFAAGGVAPAGQWSLVGERGPELIKPSVPTQVLPNGVNPWSAKQAQISINMSGPVTMGSEADVERLSERLGWHVRQQLRAAW